jgi:chaperonin GroES
MLDRESFFRESERMKPLRDIVLIVTEKPPRETAGGIALPESAQEKTGWARVAAIGSGRVEKNGFRHAPETLEVKPGDRVLVNKRDGQVIERCVDGRELVLLHVESVWAVAQ